MAELYRRSSQYREWSFTSDQLANLEASVNSASLISPDVKLSLAEERQLVLFFASDRIQKFCEYFRLPSQVRATSVAYFRRFYLKHSVMEYDPKLILPTCVFLAAKAENFFIPIHQFAEALKDIEPQQILDLEFCLFETLGFNLTVHNALRPLHGFFLDMQSSGDFDNAMLGTMHDQAKSIIVDAFANDVVFLYTPSQIALAALMESNEFVVTQYMAQSMDGPNRSLDELLEIVDKCRQYLRQQSQVTYNGDELKLVSKKLKLVHSARKEQDHEKPEGGESSAKRARRE